MEEVERETEREVVVIKYKKVKKKKTKRKARSGHKQIINVTLPHPSSRPQKFSL